jgi:hypothetical protein
MKPRIYVDHGITKLQVVQVGIEPIPSRGFYLACADGRKALAKDATESAVGSPRRIPLPPARGAQNIAREPALEGTRPPRRRDVMVAR